MLHLLAVAWLASADGFCRALHAGNLQAFEKLSDRGNVKSSAWESVREVLDRYERIEVSSCTVKSDPAAPVVVLEIDGNGAARNARHNREGIPATWYLTLSPDRAKIVSARDAAGQLVDGLLDPEKRDAALDDATRESVAGAAYRLANDARIANVAQLTAAASAIIAWSASHDSPDAEAYAYCALAIAEDRAGDGSAAQRFAAAARAIADRGSDCALPAYAEYVSGYVAADIPEAKTYLQSAADKAEELDDPRPAMAAVLHEFNIEYARFGMTEAARSLSQLEAMAARFHSPIFGLKALANRASLAGGLTEYDRAIELASRTADLARDLRQPSVEATALSVLGLSSLYKSPADDKRAASAFERALALGDELPHGLVVYIQEGLSNALLDMGHVDEAEEHFQIALAVARHDHARLANALLVGMAIRERQGRYDEEMAFAREGIEQHKEEGLWLISNFKSTLGRLLVRCGRVDEGIDTLMEAIDLIEARRRETTSSSMIRARYFAKTVSVYQTLTDALIKERRFEEALIVAERFRARSLIDDIDLGGRHAELTSSERDRLRTLNDNVTSLNRRLLETTGAAQAEVERRLRGARDELDEYNFEIAERYPREVAPEPAFTVSDLARLHSTVVEYVVLGDAIGAFVIHDGTLQYVRLSATPKAVELHTKRLSRAIDQRSIEFGSDARFLYRALIQPLASQLPRHGSLTIIPDQFLWRVPFAVLMDRHDHYLALDHGLSYAPALAVLLQSSRRPSSSTRKELLAIGDPRLSTATARSASRYRDFSVGPLPDAVTEVRSLARLYGASHSTTLIEEKATKTTFEKIVGNYRIIHLATHGIVDDSSPLYSAIVLAQSPHGHDDGLLEMREIRDLALHADIVILSACETARGSVYAGEGVIGMAWAFLSAGCPTTVVSQWKVASSSTSRLMIEFHRRLLRGESVSEALRGAQAQLIRDRRYRHPFYWAPFIVVGNDAPVMR